jgi:hypothetical protein
MKPASKLASRILGGTQKVVQDTMAGCRELAAASLAKASLTGTANGRRRHECGALELAIRSVPTHRLDDIFQTSQAIARWEWEGGEAAPKLRPDPQTETAS